VPSRDLPPRFGKWGTHNQAIGRSRGGLTTKIVARVDAFGNLAASSCCRASATTAASRC
jgi:hypothetical protein